MKNKILGSLETPRFWERTFYRHHRAFGAIIAVCSAYAFAELLRLDHPAIVLESFGLQADIINTTLFQSVRMMLLIGTALAVPFGLIVFIRPSRLKRLEHHTNRRM